MMKTSFVLLLSLMVSATFAQYLLDPIAVFGPNVNNTLRPTVETLRMLNTPVNQRAAIRAILTEADRDGNGLLSREELTGVYGILSRPLAQGFAEDYVQTEYDQGGFIRQDGQIGLDELAYLLDRQFLFWYNNRQVYSSNYNNDDNDDDDINILIIGDNNENGENTEDGFDDNNDARYDLQDTIAQAQANRADIDNYFLNAFDVADVDQSGDLTYEEFENGLEEIGDHFGLDFTWNDGHLREYYGLLLPQGQNTINREVFDRYAPVILRKLVLYSYGLLPASSQ